MYNQLERNLYIDHIHHKDSIQMHQWPLHHHNFQLLLSIHMQHYQYRQYIQ